MPVVVVVVLLRVEKNHRYYDDDESLPKVRAIRLGSARVLEFFCPGDENRENATVVLAVAELVAKSNARCENVGGI
tara:strand:+ start:206 stop:433 length:228 start_codon:yes stop_codon:yes gene_type:complete